MKIAVLSDIHGNMEALETVIEDINNEDFDKIFVLGDYAMAGPEPNSVIDYFKNKVQNPRYTLIQGNTDLMIAKYSEEIYKKLKENAPVMAEALKNDFEIITPENKLFLEQLPPQKEIEVDGVKILLVHGSPRKNNENIFPDTPLKELEAMLSDVKAQVVLCGHTHIPCGFQTETKQTVVNVGSVGRPFTENPEACYLKISVTNGQCLFEHKLSEYDKEKAANKLRNRDFIGAEKLAEMLIEPKVRHF